MVDRVLHLVASRSEAAEEFDPATFRSVQGWRDRVPGWPAAALCRPAAVFFPSPLHALRHLQDAFAVVRRLDLASPDPALDRDRDLARARGAYALGLEALALPAAELARRKGTYGALTRLVGRHLFAHPFLAEAPELVARLERHADALRDTGDPDLLREARYLREACEVARERAANRRHAGRVPDAPPDFAVGSFAPRRSGLHENEVTFEELFGVPQTLSEAEAFEALARECARDGVVTAGERATLATLGRLLGIDPEARRRAMFAPAAAGGEERDDLDPVRFFATVHGKALEDGVITSEEEALLRRLAAFLCLTPEEIAAACGR